MRVRITSYDPAKGKGTYETPTGETRTFRYCDFENEERIEGEAELIDGVLCKPFAQTIPEGFFSRLWRIIVEKVKAWLS